MALYNPRNPFDVAKFKEACKRLLDQEYYIELKAKRPKRTVQQNRYLHVLLGYYASEFGYTLDEVKFRFFKAHCNKDIFVRKRVNKRGKEVNYYRSSANLTTEEMTTTIERFRNWSASECGLYLPEANEYAHLAHAEAQIEQYKEYM